MPSVSTIFSMKGRLAPSLAQVTDEAPSSALRTASAVRTSGAVAFCRTPTPMRVFATIVFDAGSSFLSDTMASMASSVITAMSNGCPFAAVARSPLEVPNSASQAKPVCVSQPGCTATSAALTPFDTSRRIRPFCADTATGALASTPAATNETT